MMLHQSLRHAHRGSVAPVSIVAVLFISTCSVGHQPVEKVPAQPLNEAQAAETAHKKQAEAAPMQLAKAVTAQPHSVALERPAGTASTQPHQAATPRPTKAATETPRPLPCEDGTLTLPKYDTSMEQLSRICLLKTPPLRRYDVTEKGIKLISRNESSQVLIAANFEESIL